jgi:hypothetical protein
MSDQPTTVEALAEFRRNGKEIIIPSTGRPVTLKQISLGKLLSEGKVPDILTPLAIKSIYSNISDEDARGFIDANVESQKAALAHLAAIELVVQNALADQCQYLMTELTIGEKRWIFRLALLPAEILATFRSDEDVDVDNVGESD